MTLTTTSIKQNWQDVPDERFREIVKNQIIDIINEINTSDVYRAHPITVTEDFYVRQVGTYLIDASDNDIAGVLPPPVSGVRKNYNLKRIDGSANTVTITAEGTSITIDGDASKELCQWDCMSVLTDKLNYYII